MLSNFVSVNVTSPTEASISHVLISEPLTITSPTETVSIIFCASVLSICTSPTSELILILPSYVSAGTVI